MVALILEHPFESVETLVTFVHVPPGQLAGGAGVVRAYGVLGRETDRRTAQHSSGDAPILRRDAG